MFLLDASLRDMLSHQGVTPDTWILPSKVGIYLSMVPSNVVSVQEAGPSKAISDNNSNQGTAKNLTTFRGSAVCETRPFDMDFSGEPTELLRREKMIGEYYTMLVQDSPSTQNYHSDHRSIFIFNCDVDRFEKVSIEDAIEHCWRWGSSASGNPDAEHDYIQQGYDPRRARGVGQEEDPLLCHFTSAAGVKTKGVCTFLGDLPDSHFRASDVRDWADSLKRATIQYAGQDSSVIQCSEFLDSILPQNSYIAPAEISTTAGGSTPTTNNSATFAIPPRYNLFNAPGPIDSLISALQDSWDPSLASAVLGGDHPQMSYMPVMSEEQIARRFHDGFPDMWKSLVNADDFEEIRQQLVNQVQAAASDDERLGVLKRSNTVYEQSLTDKAVSRRSKLAVAGTLERAMTELQAPSSKKSRAAGLKETRQFLDKFATSVQYWQQLNEDKQVDPLSLLQEIVRDFVQPLNAADAQQMEARIESHVEGGSALTPQLLASWKSEISRNSIDRNLSELARRLKPAGVKIDRAKNSGDASAAKARENKDVYRKEVQDQINAAVIGSGSDEYKARYGDSAANTPRDLFRKMFCNIRLNKAVLKKFVEYDIIVPFGFMLMRPFIRYDMCSGILAAAGSDLGQTFMGHADFQLTDDIIHKTHIGHYTFYSKTIIHNEKKYTIAEDIFAAGYKGGENTRFYQKKRVLDSDIHSEAFSASIIAHLVPYRTNQPNAPRIQNPIDLCGKLHPTLYENSDIPEGEVEESMYPGARYLCEKLELKKLTSYASDATEHFL